MLTITKLCLALSAIAAALPAQPQRFARSESAHLPAFAASLHSGWRRATVTLDLEPDGDLDVVEVPLEGPAILRRNTGSRDFPVVGTIPPPAGTSLDHVAAGDLDGDGVADLLVGTGHTFQVLANRAGAFVALGSFTATPSAFPRALPLTDIDGDLDLDVIIGEQVFVNDGNGRLTELPNSLPLIGSGTVAITAFDADGDGDSDLALNSEILLNDGSGRFTVLPDALPPGTSASRQILVLDAENDRDLDLFLPRGGSAGSLLLLNRGNGRFDAAAAPRPRIPESAAVFDFDRDGRTDIAYGGRDGTVLLANTAGGFVPSRAPLADTRSPFLGAPPAIVDADRDSDPDLVAGDAFWLNHASGERFVDAVRRSGVEPPAIAVDVDGDLDLDVIGTASDSKLRGVGLNDGTGQLGRLRKERLPESWHLPVSFPTRILSDDLDGDRDPDLLLLRQSAPAEVALNDGRGTFTLASLLPEQATTTAGDLADFDGNGRLDAVIGFHGIGLALLSDNGSGRLATVGLLPFVAARPFDVVAMDLDRDGDADLATIETDNLNHAIWLVVHENRGGFRFGIVAALPLPVGGVRSLLAGDVDGDGDDDLLANGELVENRGGTLVLRGVSFALLDPWLVDVDLDSDLDVLGQSTSWQNVLFVQSSPWTFTDETRSIPPGRANAPSVFGDFDGDGDPDAVAPASVLANLHRQITFTRVPQRGGVLEMAVFASPGYGSSVAAAWILLAAGTAHIDLGALGVLRLDPATTIGLPPVLLHDPAGRTDVVLPVPNSPSLSGIELHAQALLVQGASLAQWRLTGRATVRVVD